MKIQFSKAFFSIFALFVFLVTTEGLAQQSDTAAPMKVTSSAELSSALSAAQSAGTTRTLSLAPGTYARIALTNSRTPIRVVAADPTNPPRIGRLQIEKSANVTFEDVVFDFVFDPDRSALWTSPFQLDTAQNIVFDRVVFSGDLMSGSGTDGDGFPAGRGLRILNSDNITLRDGEIEGFWVGINILESRNFTLTGSRIHGTRKDHMTIAQVENVLIEGNHFGAHHRAFAFDDHPDMIQLWTRNTTAPSKHVTIRNNIFNSGRGPWSQTIFFRNDRVDKGLAGPELFYRDLLIEGNVILNSHTNAIVVGETDGLVVRNNTLIRNAASEEAGMSDVLASPSIRVAQKSQNVEILDNAAFRFPRHTGRNWVQRNNVTIQATDPSAAGYYGAVFSNALQGDPSDITSYGYKTGGVLARHGVGADLLDPSP